MRAGSGRKNEYGRSGGGREWVRVVDNAERKRDIERKGRKRKRETG